MATDTWFTRLFGYKVEAEPKEDERRVTFSEPINNDGATEVNSFAGGFLSYGANLDYEAPQDEVQLITKYREISNQPEFNKAIQDIVNETFSYDEDSMPIVLDLSNVKINDKLKKQIQEEYDQMMKMLNFKTDAYDIFRRWYIDGRLFYHKVIDTKKPKDGIKELRYIDPRKIKKVKEKITNKQMMNEQGFTVNESFKEYYVYNPGGINNKDPRGLKIAKDTISFVPSGLLTKDNKTVISYLHQSIRAFNSLRQMEDSLVIYRMARASEKRVFNVEVGDLTKTKAEQYLQLLMDRFRKKMTYNPETGEVMEQKRFLSMQEDFWFPKRDGKGTTVDQLPGGQSLSDLDDVNYMKQKLYESLNVPVGRLDPASQFNIGRTSEITRDELKFQKFINRLRKKFNILFEDILKTQLLLKKIVTEQEWNDVIYPDMKIDYIEDNFFTELKWTEIYQNRFNAMRDAMEANQNGFVSKEWIRENILKINDDDAKEIKKQIDAERSEDDSLIGDQSQDQPGSDKGTTAVPAYKLNNMQPGRDTPDPTE